MRSGHRVMWQADPLHLLTRSPCRSSFHSRPLIVLVIVRIAEWMLSRRRIETSWKKETHWIYASLTSVPCKQGNQIGWIFAYRAIIYLQWEYFWNCICSKLLGSFFVGKNNVYHNFDNQICWAIFLAIFSQTRLVTLIASKGLLL
jgi:hypothetical protein